MREKCLIEKLTIIEFSKVSNWIQIEEQQEKKGYCPAGCRESMHSSGF
jgi:hypothetical protein